MEISFTYLVTVLLIKQVIHDTSTGHQNELVNVVKGGNFWSKMVMFSHDYHANWIKMISKK